MLERNEETVLKTVFKEDVEKSEETQSIPVEETSDTENSTEENTNEETSSTENDSTEENSTEENTNEETEEEVSEYSLGKYILNNQQLFLPDSEKGGLIEFLLKRMCKNGFIQRKKTKENGMLYIPTAKLYRCFSSDER